MLLTDSGEPECYEEVVQVETRKKWEQAMKEQMDSLAHNQTWDLFKLPAGKTTLQNKWVYKMKEEDGGKRMKQERHRYMWFTQFGLHPWRNSQSFFYYIIQQTEEIQPTTDPL